MQKRPSATAAVASLALATSVRLVNGEPQTLIQQPHTSQFTAYQAHGELTAHGERDSNQHSVVSLPGRNSLTGSGSRPWSMSANQSRIGTSRAAADMAALVAGQAAAQTA